MTTGFVIKPEIFLFRALDIGLQLYIVREPILKDVASTLAKVPEIGFTIVEGATYTGTQLFYDMEPAAFTAILKQHNLKMPSCHYRLGEEMSNGQPVKGTMLHGWDKAVDDASKVGIQYMVCAWLSDLERGNIDHYKLLADRLNKAGERCKKNGITRCYHNHDFEFDAQNGVVPYNILLKDTDPKLVKMELDLYWVSRAGQNAIAMFNKNPGRFPLFHMKDMDSTPNKDFTEVGNGTIDFASIVANKKKEGLKCFFVEQDQTPGDPFVSIKKSYDYIRKNLV